jgi:hypothetical protein
MGRFRITFVIVALAFAADAAANVRALSRVRIDVKSGSRLQRLAVTYHESGNVSALRSKGMRELPVAVRNNRLSTLVNQARIRTQSRQDFELSLSATRADGPIGSDGVVFMIPAASLSGLFRPDGSVEFTRHGLVEGPSRSAPQMAVTHLGTEGFLTAAQMESMLRRIPSDMKTEYAGEVHEFVLPGDSGPVVRVVDMYDFSRAQLLFGTNDIDGIRANAFAHERIQDWGLFRTVSVTRVVEPGEPFRVEVEGSVLHLFPKQFEIVLERL